jgi:serine/threonine protein kinase
MSSHSNKSTCTALSASTRLSPAVENEYHHPEEHSDKSCFSSSCNDVGHFINTGNDSMIFIKELHRKRIVKPKASIKVAKYVSKHYHALLDSNIFQQLQQQIEQEQEQHQRKRASKIIRRFDHSEIELGNMLGKGSFSNVFEIKQCPPLINSDECVIKVLGQHVLDNPAVFACCALGLARESVILEILSEQHIQHPNIITVKGRSIQPVEAYATGRNDACFLIMDKLQYLLNDKIEDWKQQRNKIKKQQRYTLSKLLAFRRRRNTKVMHEQQCHDVGCFLYGEQLKVGVDLANAVSYLHKHRILHRDLKPGNIGFDSNNTLKVFDFDVSTILPQESYQDELFHLTAMIGTRRYMAREVGLGMDYNLKADVYSYAIILWNILSLKIPFKGYSKVEHHDEVFVHGERPTINKSWSQTVQLLLERAWSNDISTRPTMDCIYQAMQHEYESMMNDHFTQTRCTERMQLSSPPSSPLQQFVIAQ